MGWDDWKWTVPVERPPNATRVELGEVIDVLYSEQAITRFHGKSLQARAARAATGRPVMVVLTDDHRIGMWDIVFARVMGTAEWNNLRGELP
ncbi:MAG: hypothetical protein HOV79_18285 [Hamadaea sp.]|nr:hypothetical protein [Hamadaea sp.]